MLSYSQMEKKVIQLPEAIAFARGMSVASQKQYYAALDVLEVNGRLSAPRAEKVEGVDNMFAIRILTRGNERFFYCYEEEDSIYVLHGYAKKRSKIPRSELEKALSIRKRYFGE